MRLTDSLISTTGNLLTNEIKDDRKKCFALILNVNSIETVSSPLIRNDTRENKRATPI